ncbi:glycogen debranching protein GlgX [Vibrio sp. S4M6]|uniref:glycogen debranching protein GlgX n=1 Tax=Vibrio sinus TaxID=2946865 RepID=UPI00202A9FB5|nr:glycogen debranching protein GlgX [Vibrio sinus]MCL9780163.1 glycogen debranching protein GlgX [Vibrio sinus]
MTKVRSRPYPLGATLDSNGCNFSIYAPKDNVKLVLFEGSGHHYHVHTLNNVDNGIRHTYIDEIHAEQRYGYLIELEGIPHLISDPYAKALDQPLHYQPPFSSLKSFQLAKSVVIDDDFDWQHTVKPAIPRTQLVLFETHVKGVTQLNPLVEAEHRGKYLGLVSPAMLDFYKQQNINALQLLPIAACMHEPHLLEMDMVNYWGYNPFLFMVPDPRYALSNAPFELKTAIRELHKHGIEVILDVVYNHTAEGGETGPIFNLKALDEHYYLLHEEQHVNYTGCGNTLDLTHQPSLNLVMDTLRYWVTEYQVDGFRFDLAATLGRNGDDFNSESAFFKAVAQDPILRDVKLIAEPWDIGPNGYQVGHFPTGWNECNDRLRDITRSFWRGDFGFLNEYATRVMGSRDLYSASDWPYNLTVNYITYHDGFTMQDLVSYKHKHNEANGEENRDGHGDNRSDNYGTEGETKSPRIIAIREKQKRNMMASLLFSFGIPHILMADVLSHSQQGNNNAYCQDNEISWLDWTDDTSKRQFQQWLAGMVQARQQYMAPIIEGFCGEKRNHNRVLWKRCNGEIMDYEDWNQLNSLALHISIGQDGAGEELFYCINQTSSPTRFVLPCDNEQRWTMVCNTACYDLNIETNKQIVLLASTSMAIFYFNPD